jgi:hypothetical protein
VDGTNQPDGESGDLKAVKRCASNFRLALKGSRKSLQENWKKKTFKTN